jgi:hypothetical protein
MIKKIKLKNKTELRKIIKNGWNTTLTFDILHVYQDGTWNFLSRNSDVTHKFQYPWNAIFRIRNEIENINEIDNISDDKCISNFFKKIEDDIN